MSIQAELTRLERWREDLDQALAVARNEGTGRVPQLLEEVRLVEARMEALRPFVEPVTAPRGQMQPCGGCGRPFWPESLADGRCEFCGPPGGEEPSESIQSVKRKGSRASRG